MKYPKWYERLEPGIKKVVYLLRNNGFNTVSSCGEEMWVQILGDAEDIKPLWDFLVEKGYHDFNIAFTWETYPFDRRFIEVRFMRAEKKEHRFM